jgi:hypothetical protein
VTETNQSVEFGHPEFWGQAYASFPKFFEVIPRAGDALNGLTMHRRYENVNPWEKVIFNLGLLTGFSVMELITLVGNGFGLGAMKIARTILESSINAEYLRLFPEECDDYLEWHWVEQYRLLKYVRGNMPDRLSELTDIEGTEKGFESSKARFLRKDGELRGSWCRLDLGSRAARTGFADAYKLIYPFGSQLIHGSFGGLAMHFDTTEESARISPPPSLSWCEQALVGGHMCLYRVVATLSLTFKTEPSPPLAQLKSDFDYAWNVARRESSQ